MYTVATPAHTMHRPHRPHHNHSYNSYDHRAQMRARGGQRSHSLNQEYSRGFQDKVVYRSQESLGHFRGQTGSGFKDSVGQFKGQFVENFGQYRGHFVDNVGHRSREGLRGQHGDSIGNRGQHSDSMGNRGQQEYAISRSNGNHGYTNIQGNNAYGSPRQNETPDLVKSKETEEKPVIPKPPELPPSGLLTVNSVFEPASGFVPDEVAIIDGPPSAIVDQNNNDYNSASIKANSVKSVSILSRVILGLMITTLD